MGMRWSVGVVGMVLMVCWAGPSGWAADESTVDAVVDGEADDLNREQILQTIEATRQTDPELAAEMERQFESMDAGHAPLTAAELQGLPTSAEATTGRGADAAGALSGSGRNLQGAPQVSRGDASQGGTTLETAQAGGGRMGGAPQDPRFNEVQADPRMQELHRQVEGGQLSDTQARERVFDILRDHGIQPDNGREWESHGGGGPGNERAWEHMAPEAREQMERLFGHEGGLREGDGRSETDHATSERYREGFGHEMERSSGSSDRSHEAAMREPEGVAREYEAASREYAAPEHETSTAERSYEMPMREYEAPTQEREGSERTYESMPH